MRRSASVILPLLAGAIAIVVSAPFVDDLGSAVADTFSSTPTTTSSGSSTAYPSEGPQPTGPSPTQQSYPGPTLLQDHLDQARAIAEADPLIQEILAMTDYEISEYGPWSDSGNLIGIIALVDLDTPVTLEADWPGRLVEDDGSIVDYKEHRHVVNLKSVNILIDLQTETVAEIRFVEFGEVIQPTFPPTWRSTTPNAIPSQSSD